MLPHFQSPALQHSGINHGFFTRQGGTSTGRLSSLNVSLNKEDHHTVQKNRSRIANHIDCQPSQMVWLTQTHSSVVHHYQEPVQSDITADALVTDLPQICLCIQTADCAPILLYEPQTQMIGAIHAGWRGALDGVIEATIDHMRSAGCNPSQIIAAIGPSIHQDSYQVDHSFYDQHLEKDQRAHSFFITKAGHYYFDLPGYCHYRLAQQGLIHINIIQQNTYPQDTLFFSCRRATHNQEALFGNQASCIMLTSTER